MTNGQFEHLAHQHREAIEALILSGIFETRNGRAELHFNNDGTLQSVRVEQKIYQRGYPLDNRMNKE